MGGSLQRPLEPRLAGLAGWEGRRLLRAGRGVAFRGFSCWAELGFLPGCGPPAGFTPHPRVRARLRAIKGSRSSLFVCRVALWAEGAVRGKGAGLAASRGVGRPPEVTARRLPVRPVGAGAVGKRRAGLAAGCGDGPGQVMGPVPHPGCCAARGGPGRRRRRPHAVSLSAGIPAAPPGAARWRR